MIRIAHNQDSQGVIDLISRCYSEYDDLVCLEPGGAEAELLDLEANYRGKRGRGGPPSRAGARSARTIG